LVQLREAVSVHQVSWRQSGRSGGVVADWPVRPSGCEAQKPMAMSETRAVTILLTKEHLRKMIEDHLLKENEIGDRITVARIVQKLLDTSLGLPDRPWHDWDDWVKGLE